LHEHGEGNTIGIPADGTFYGRYLAWAAEHGLVLEDQNGDLMPDALITREQMAVIVDRYIRGFGLIEYFDFPVPSWPAPADEKDISAWAHIAVLYLRDYRLLRGNFGEVHGWFFRPQDATTRAETLAIFVRMCRAIYEGKFPIWN